MVYLCNTGELGYDGPLYDRLLAMTDNMLGPSPVHIKHVMFRTDFAYDGPIFLVPLSLSYPSLSVVLLFEFSLTFHAGLKVSYIRTTGPLVL